MKYHSEYSKQYVQDICNALNDEGMLMLMDDNTQKSFAPENFETLTRFLQVYIVMPLGTYTFLDQKGLINRGRCPYTGQRIDDSFPSWTYMRTRRIYVSHEGHSLMKKEDDEEYEILHGHPRPPRKKGCYIATVCYGSESAPQVITLKIYRDEILSKSVWGRIFIKIYYMISPTLARFLQDKTNINNLLRRNILDKIVNRIKIL